MTKLVKEIIKVAETAGLERIKLFGCDDQAQYRLDNITRLHVTNTGWYRSIETSKGLVCAREYCMAEELVEQLTFAGSKEHPLTAAATTHRERLLAAY